MGLAIVWGGHSGVLSFVYLGDRGRSPKDNALVMQW